MMHLYLVQATISSSATLLSLNMRLNYLSDLDYLFYLSNEEKKKKKKLVMPRVEKGEQEKMLNLLPFFTGRIEL